MRNPQIDALYPATPDGFHQALERAASALTERAPARRSFRLVLACAIIGALLVGSLAYAMVTHWGVLDFLTSYAPTQRAQEIIQSGLESHYAMVGDVKFELTEAAYDGQQIYLSLKMSADGQPVAGWFGWGAGDSNLVAGVNEVTLNGQPVDFDPSETQIKDDIAYAMLTIPHEFDGAQTADIALTLMLLHADTDEYEYGELTYRMQALKTVAHDQTFDEPITMNGVTVTKIRLSYTPLKLYAWLDYTLDPDLPRFERLRRENMFFTLTHDGKSLSTVGGTVSQPDENGIITGSCELEAAANPHDTLTVSLDGRDGETYWSHTINFKEAKP